MAKYKIGDKFIFPKGKATWVISKSITNDFKVTCIKPFGNWQLQEKYNVSVFDLDKDFELIKRIPTKTEALIKRLRPKSL